MRAFPSDLPAAQKKGTVVIVDAMEFRRAGVATLLQPWAQSGGLDLVLSALEEAQQMLEQKADCRMLIVNLGGDPVTSEEMLKYLSTLHLLAPDIPLVVMSDQLAVDEVAAALGVGAMGYMHTGAMLEFSLQALSFILNGGSYFPPAALRQIQPKFARGRFSPGNDGQGNGSGNSRSEIGPIDGQKSKVASQDCDARTLELTNRQKAVLDCLRHGDSNKFIARRLGMSETTVKVHVRQIMRKLGAANRTQVAILVCSPPAGSDWSVAPINGHRSGSAAPLAGSEI